MPLNSLNNRDRILPGAVSNDPTVVQRGSALNRSGRQLVTLGGGGQTSCVF